MVKAQFLFQPREDMYPSGGAPMALLLCKELGRHESSQAGCVPKNVPWWSQLSWETFNYPRVSGAHQMPTIF